MVGIKQILLAGLLASVSAGLLFLSRRPPGAAKVEKTTLLAGAARTLGPLVTVVYPESVREETSRKFAWAGIRGMHPEDLLALKLACAIVFPALAFAFTLAGKSPVPLLLLAFLGYVFPDIWLNRKVRERQEKIRRDTPEFAVLLATVLEAGGGDVRAALAQVARHLGGEVGKEVETALHAMETGKRPPQALRDMADRCGVDELTQLVRTITQAMFYGSPVAEAVKAYAAQTRLMRRHEAEKRVREQTVKLVFPMVVFIVFPLMVLLAYPALQQFGQVLR